MILISFLESVIFYEQKENPEKKMLINGFFPISIYKWKWNSWRKFSKESKAPESGLNHKFIYLYYITKR